MEINEAIEALAALAQESRLEAFRLLVQAGPEGLQAGQIAMALGVPPNTLTFHFDRLRMARLVSVRRDGRAMIYTAQYTTMNALLAYLTENCCGGLPCTPEHACEPALTARQSTSVKERT